MKKIRCRTCDKKWYVDSGEEKFLSNCPFCGDPVREKGTLEDIDTLGKAIYRAVSDRGIEILENKGRISGYLFDIIPDMKREVRIFSKTFDDRYLTLYRESFGQDTDTIKLTMNRLKRMFVEDEGLSDLWAGMICENCLQAVMYYKGDGLPEVMIAEITDVEYGPSEPIQVSVRDRTPEPVPTEKTGGNLRGVRIGGSIPFGNSGVMWTVLDIDAGGVLLHYAREDIKKRFNKKFANVSWENCSLRTELRQYFFSVHNSFFSKEEEAAILSKTGNGLRNDQVFCLSIEEAEKYRYVIRSGYHPWLLRSPGKNKRFVATFEKGKPNLWGVYSDYLINVRPAIYVSADYFSS